MSTQDLLMFRKTSKILLSAFQDVYQLCGKELQRRAKKRGHSFQEGSQGPVSSSQEGIQRNSIPKPVQKKEKTTNRRNKLRQKLKKAVALQHDKISQRPRAPLTPYLSYVAKNKSQIAKKHQGMKTEQIENIMKSVWKDMTQQEREPFTEQYEQLKTIYEKRLQIFLAGQDQHENNKKDQKIIKITRKEETKDMDEDDQQLDSTAEKKLKKKMAQVFKGLPGIVVRKPQSQDQESPDSQQLRLLQLKIRFYV